MEVIRNKETMLEEFSVEEIISDWENETLGEDSDFRKDSDIEMEEGSLEKETEMGERKKVKKPKWKNRKDMTVEERRERNKQEKLRKRRKKVCKKCNKMGHNIKQCGKYCTKCKMWRHQKKECRVVKETENP